VVLSIKLRRLGAWTAARRQVAAWYGAALEGLPLERVAIAPGAASSHHLEVVRTAARDRLREALAAEGIATGIHYPIPCHLQPAFAAPAPPRLPVAERAAGRILSLPMHPHLREADVQRVAAAIARVLQDAPEAHPAPCAA
jgi:dTDP-4-amino-4,6-dideoxygalactose transaminase